MGGGSRRSSRPRQPVGGGVVGKGGDDGADAAPGMGVGAACVRVGSEIIGQMPFS